MEEDDPTPKIGTDRLVELPVSVPDKFARAVGYFQDQQHVMIRYAPGNEVVYSDGQLRATGRLHPFLRWDRTAGPELYQTVVGSPPSVDHRLSTLLERLGLDLGGELPGNAALVFDRYDDRVFVGTIEQARSFLDRFNDPDDLDAEAFERVLNEWTPDDESLFDS